MIVTLLAVSAVLLGAAVVLLAYQVRGLHQRQNALHGLLADHIKLTSHNTMRTIQAMRLLQEQFDVQRELSGAGFDALMHLAREANVDL